LETDDTARRAAGAQPRSSQRADRGHGRGTAARCVAARAWPGIRPPC